MKIYAAIDLKSFYASVECVERHLDPLTTNLVVADKSKTEKTICLAVSPSLKSYGISGRARLFEVIQKVKEVNTERQRHYPLTKKSYDNTIIQNNPHIALGYLIAPPRMAYYIAYSTKIYDVYLKYFAPEDIHVYSIDEVFIDLSSYLKIYGLSPQELVKKVILDIYETTHITATAGIGENLYLAKVAMDILSKHSKEDIKIAYLDKQGYKKQLWSHTPITDFWRIGNGYKNKLASLRLYTMGDVARYSLSHQEELYKVFGINAELLIDHAWGEETCSIKDIKSYKPEAKSMTSGQVLSAPYPYTQAKLVLKEMCEQLSLDLLEKHYVTTKITLTVGYDIENKQASQYVEDRYGRRIPKSAHGTTSLKFPTHSTKLVTEAILNLFDSIIDQKMTIRRFYLYANVIKEEKVKNETFYEQIDIFSDFNDNHEEKEALTKETQLQQTLLDIKKKYGKNSVVKVRDLDEGATTITRNNQIGGHKA